MKYGFTTVCAVIFLAACTNAPPTVDTSPNADVSFDGLHKINNSIFPHAWADPEIDFSVYDQYMGGGAYFEFRAVKRTTTASAATRNNTDEFWIDDDARSRLIDEVGAIFREELTKSTRFTEASEPGPNVLIIRGGLLDIVSRVPPDMIGRSDVYLRSVGEAALVLEAVDSLSGETIYRATDRRSAERPSGSAFYATPVTTWTEVRRVAQEWASKLREGLDSLPAS